MGWLEGDPCGIIEGYNRYAANAETGGDKGEAEIGGMREEEARAV